MAEDQVAAGAEDSREPNGAESEETVSKAEYDKLLAQSRRWERQSKSNAEKARKYDEAQAASLSDKERADKAEAELERYRHAEERRKWVASVSKDTGVPADVLEGMEAGTEDELRERAESISSYFTGRPVTPVVRTEGRQPETPKPSKTANQWLRDSIPDSIRRHI